MDIRSLLPIEEPAQDARPLAERLEHDFVEAEAWRIAQLAATLAAPLAAAGKPFEWVDLVKTARALLAESRRQAAAPAEASHGL